MSDMAGSSLRNGFECLLCGKCCHHPTSDYSEKRYIPIYLDEIVGLVTLAEERGVVLKLEEDVMFPDFLNKRLILISCALKFPDVCPFYDDVKRCTIYEYRPLTCRAYPVSIWREDGFRTLMHIESECAYINSNKEELGTRTFKELKDFFPMEYERAKELMIKGKEILYKIIELEMAKLIDVGFLNRDINFFFTLENESPEFLDWPRVKITDLEVED